VAQCGFAARFKTEGGLAKNIGRDGLNHGIGPFVLGADCGRALANRVAEDESQCVTDQKRLASLLQDLLFRNPRKQALIFQSFLPPAVRGSATGTAADDVGVTAGTEPDVGAR
jgi:hypothetical protein